MNKRETGAIRCCSSGRTRLQETKAGDGHLPIRGDRNPIGIQLHDKFRPRFRQFRFGDISMKRDRKGRAPQGWRWVRKETVWHVRAKRWIRRKDGKPFCFLVRIRS